jgi:hypothetical protein
MEGIVLIMNRKDAMHHRLTHPRRTNFPKHMPGRRATRFPHFSMSSRANTMPHHVMCNTSSSACSFPESRLEVALRQSLPSRLVFGTSSRAPQRPIHHCCASGSFLPRSCFWTCHSCHLVATDHMLTHLAHSLRSLIIRFSSRGRRRPNARLRHPTKICSSALHSSAHIHRIHRLRNVYADGAGASQDRSPKKALIMSSSSDEEGAGDPAAGPDPSPSDEASPPAPSLSASDGEPPVPPSSSLLSPALSASLLAAVTSVGAVCSDPSPEDPPGLVALLAPSLRGLPAPPVARGPPCSELWAMIKYRVDCMTSDLVLIERTTGRGLRRNESHEALAAHGGGRRLDVDQHDRRRPREPSTVLKDVLVDLRTFEQPHGSQHHATMISPESCGSQHQPRDIGPTADLGAGGALAIVVSSMHASDPAVPPYPPSIP